MMKRYIAYLLIGICCSFWACTEDEDLTPSMKDQDRLEELLDKSNPEIVAFKEKYGTYILYEFDHMKDFAYQFEEAINWNNAKLTYLKQEDASGALAFLKQNFLAYYQDSLLLNCFPRKFLICNQISAASLGISSKSIYHDAVVNSNSMTFASLDKVSLNDMTTERKTSYCQQLHYIYLAGYIIDVRREIFVNSIFFDPGSKLYGTKIDKSAGEPGEAHYLSLGFFSSAEKSKNFYPARLDDLMTFIEKLVKMDQQMCDKVKKVSVMRIKMEYVVEGLSALGVDIVGINPLAANFLK